MDVSSPLLTVPEAAQYLRIKPGALFTQRHRGQKPDSLGIRYGKRVVYRVSDIEAWLDELSAAREVAS